MKNKDIISSVVGAGFFAVGYIGLSLTLAPALLVGAGAFVASELVINGSKKKIEEIKELSYKDKLIESKREVKYLKDMVNKIDNEDVSSDIENIAKSADKIVNRIEEGDLHNKVATKFMDYYLPVCVKIVGRYDEIENQALTSRDSKEFMSNTAKILKATNKAFRKILNSLYQNDIVDADAEMKVFNSMLTADGFDETLIQEGGEEDE